jgi:hypothetical protein
VLFAQSFLFQNGLDIEKTCQPQWFQRFSACKIPKKYFEKGLDKSGILWYTIQAPKTRQVFSAMNLEN